MKKSQRKKKLPKTSKQIKDFLLSEEGKISHKSIAKLGFSLTAAAMVFNADTPVSAGHNNYYTHESALFTTAPGGHASRDPHSSHGSHGSHGQW